MSADLKIQIVGKQCVELDAGQASFRQECPMLFDQSEEVAGRILFS